MTTLILLCASDHTEADAQPTRYTVEHLRRLKNRHELWVGTRLHVGPGADEEATRAISMRSGDDLCPLLHGTFGWQVGLPEGLTDEEEDLIESAVQTITD